MLYLYILQEPVEERDNGPLHKNNDFDFSDNGFMYNFNNNKNNQDPNSWPHYFSIHNQ